MRSCKIRQHLHLRDDTLHFRIASLEMVTGDSPYISILFHTWFEGPFRTQRRGKFHDLRPGIICLIEPSWRQSFDIPPLLILLLPTLESLINVSIRLFLTLFSKQIRLFWQVLTPIRAILTSISTSKRL